MKKKKEKEKWTLVSRKPMGLYLSGRVHGPGWGNLGYYHIVYEVLEHCSNEFRTRVESGATVRDYGEGYDALCSLYNGYYQKALDVDEGRLTVDERGKKTKRTSIRETEDKEVTGTETVRCNVVQSR